MKQDTSRQSYHAAKNLYCQRKDWLLQDKIHIGNLIYQEQRLHASIASLSSYTLDSEQESASEADLFTCLAMLLANSEQQKNMLASKIIFEKMLDDCKHLSAIADAMILFPKQPANETLYRVLNVKQQLLPVILYIVGEQGGSLLRALDNSLYLKKNFSYLQDQMLSSALQGLKINTLLFRHYSRYINGDRMDDNLDQLAFMATIWEGLVKDDEKTLKLLYRIIELENDDTHRQDLLRLGALTGSNMFYALIEEEAQTNPEIGYYLLGLNGSSAAVDCICKGLSRPTVSKYASRAWWWVSGQILPGRFHVSSKQIAADLNTEVAQLIPERQIAENWWKKKTRDRKIRWFQGELLNARKIIFMLNNYTGAIAADLQDLLSFTIKHPLQLGISTWQHKRLENINAINQSVQYSSGS